MATHSITNVTLLTGSADSRRAAGNSAGIVAEGRQDVAATKPEVQTRETQPSDSQNRDAAVSQQEIEDAVSSLKEFVQNMQRDMDFSVDDMTGRFVVKVIDSQTKELIRQIPSEEVLAISRSLAEALGEQDQPKGFLIELKA